MQTKWKEILPADVKENVFKIISTDWMLITGKKDETMNTMTASWGSMGILWHKPVTFCFIRPTRYTYHFIEQAQTYTLCFFDESYKDALTFCGTKSGRDCDKIAHTQLTPVQEQPDSVYFEEARLVFICKKIYYNDLDAKNFLSQEIQTNYPQKDYHRMYCGEIIKILAKAE